MKQSIPQLDHTNTKVTMQVFMVSKFPLEFGTLFANTSLGNSNSKCHRQSLITSMFAELKIYYQLFLKI